MEKKQEKKSKLVLLLKELVDRYLKEHPHQSIHSFSKKCGVSFSTLRRIVCLKTKEDPIPSTVLGIVSAVTKEKNIHQLIKRFDGEIRACLERSYACVYERTAYRPELSDILEDREVYIIYKLAANRTGTTRQDVIELLGVPAEEKIDELIKIQLLHEESSTIHAACKEFSLPIHLVKKHIPELLRFSNAGSRYINKTLIRSLSESVSKEAYDEIWKIQAEAGKKITELLSRKESSGKIPLFITYVLDTIEAPRRRPENSDNENK